MLNRYFGKLISNAANRKDPKFIIVEGDYKGLPYAKIKDIESQGFIVHRCNSVMFVKMKVRELKENNIKHITFERW